MSRYRILNRLVDLGRTQVDVLLELRNRGYKTNRAMLSEYIRGVNTQPKSEIILEAADKIISEWEAERNAS